MMEASLVPDTGQTGPLIAVLDPPSIQPSSPLSPPAQASSRPLRPKPPAPKPSSQHPSRAPQPPATPPSLPPPLPPIVKPPCFNPPPNLPEPLSPTPAPNPTSPVPQTDASPSLLAASPSSSSSSMFDSLTSPAPLALSLTEQLLQTSSIWRPKGLSQDQATTVLKEEQAGTFLVHSTEEKGMTLSVRLPDEQGLPVVHNLVVKQHKTLLHLDSSFLAFDDVFKLVSFYCVSRDILPLLLRLPQAIATATKKEELEVISATGKDFWTSNLHQLSKKQGCGEAHSRLFLYLNPVIVEENPTKDQNEPSTSSKPETVTSPDVALPLQNGETPEKVSLEVKGQNKPNVEMKYKRPPPRPPSLSTGMGLLFSTTASHHSSASAPAEKKKEEAAGEKEDRKSTAAHPPSRPSVRPQNRAAPPVPPAPLRRSSSRKSTDRERAEGTEREKGHNLTKQNEKEGVGEPGEEKEGNRPAALLHEEEESGCQQQQGEVKADDEKDKGKQNEETLVKEPRTEDKQKPSAQCPPLVKKPSRPVPPPRRKPLSPETPLCPNQAGGGGGVTRLPPPSPGRRPDVSLYSPQGGAVLAADPDSASTSSTEEEAETHDQSRYAESRSPKAEVKRTPTTVILDRARHRLSTVLTGLISHDRRLTQRIVELARDPSSYFGNLVKEHRTFTLETMSKHASSTELLQEIRQMMTQLKSYLLQSTELHAMLEPQHQYAQDKLENIVEAALCKSVLKPLREPIYQCLEKLHNDSGSINKLSQNQSAVLGSTTTALGVTTAVPEASAMEKISIKLSNLHLEYSPQRKIEMLLKACKIIYDSMSVSSPGRAHGADDFLPVMMYVLARSNLSALQLDVEYMMELMDPALTLGEGSYYLTTTYGALEHIKTFDQQRSATRQLSREVQDSIHRWERRRTLNQERMAQGSIRDFLTVCCPTIGTNPKTLGVLPTTTIQQLTEQCATRFEQEMSLQDSTPDYILSVFIDDVHRPLVPTEMALSVKNSCQPGAYCFVYHPVDQPIGRPTRNAPTDPPPVPPPVSSPVSPPVSPPVPPPVPPTTPPPVPLTVPRTVPPTVPPPIPACAPPSTPPPIPPPCLPPAAPTESSSSEDTAPTDAVAPEAEEESLISL